MNLEQFLGWLENQPFFISSQEKPLIMGVLNITPDSFFDGGQFTVVDKAINQALTMIAEGADLIDIGGESAKPGAIAISAAEELSRVIPVIEELRRHSDICISIDTYKPEVMVAAVKAGANVINDIYALQQPGALAAAAQLNVPVCLMHMQGTPQHMQQNPHYPQGVVEAIMSFFAERIAACEQAGIKRQQLILDPGFGFGKLVQDNLILTQQSEIFKEFSLPLLLGVSRKSTIGAVLGIEANERLIGSIALTVYAALKGVAIFRTHDVGATNQALLMIDAVRKAG
ncbi:MAG: dihydropteroate synthase [Legionella sp.]|nr:MAG: dihydropteroate synthase [Legionella sp.]